MGEGNSMESRQAMPMGLPSMSTGGASLTTSMGKMARGGGRRTHISDLPGAVLTCIFGAILDPRTRNNMARSCKDWYCLERLTRRSLILRGNVANFQELGSSFGNITQLDLSCCSPWGYSVFQSASTGGEVVGQFLKKCFPKVKDAAIYVRDAVDIEMVVWLWPDIETLRLVRWHQRPMEPECGVEQIGSELQCILKCKKLRKLDLSKFYCWTEDILPALGKSSPTAENLLYLDLLKISPEGFKTQEIIAITAACKNLEELFLLCEFDPRFLDSLGDKALISIASNCPRLRRLHLVDNNEWGMVRSDLDDDFASVDANVTPDGLIGMFRLLPNLEDLALLLGQNVRDAGPALESLLSHCRKLASLQLSNFHGVCFGLEEGGLAAGNGLAELSIKNSADLSDSALEAIGRACKMLKKLSLKGCKGITEQGLKNCVSMLADTLINVEISFCSQLPAVETLRALEPIRNSIQYLHMDGTWDVEVVDRQALISSSPVYSSTPHRATNDDVLRSEMEKRGFTANFFWDTGRRSTTVETEIAALERKGRPSTSQAQVPQSISEGLPRSRLKASSGEEPPDDRCWNSLRALSIWMGVGLAIAPLPNMGLGRCPALSEVTIKVEGDCKGLRRPSAQEWGLACLSRYSSLVTLNLDLSEVVSFSMSAPEGQVDLSIWERHYLSGIDRLQLRQLDYRPPCDQDLNHRSLSLPAAGFLSQCAHLRKLIVHGSAHEHFLSMIQSCPSLRDFQLRWDYYPAPEYDTSTEVRIDACRRFEKALEERGYPD